MSKLKLNLGCASNIMEGYVNIDQDDIEEIRKRYPNKEFSKDAKIFTYNIFKLPYKDWTVDEVLDEKIVKREKRTSQHLRKQKLSYRKNRQKIKQRMKKKRKSSGAKLLQKKSARMKKMGKTATGRDISVRGGSGSEQRLKKKKTDIRR